MNKRDIPCKKCGDLGGFKRLGFRFDLKLAKNGTQGEDKIFLLSPRIMDNTIILDKKE
jgi:hypothetical protein